MKRRPAGAAALATVVAACVVAPAWARALPAAFGQLEASEVTAGSVSQEPKKYPVSKVITLLKDMQEQLEKEADQDEEVYNNMVCWCKTNDKEKTQAVADAQTSIAQLTTVIETTAAESARLAQELETHQEDLAKSKESLDTATAIREKQLASFTDEEKDMLQSIKALEAAIIVLSKHQAQGASFLDRGLGASVAATVQYQLERHSSLLMGIVTPQQRRLVLALGQQPSYRQSYSSQSGEIFGILRQMKETFESNLAETQKDETWNRQAYEELKAAKEAEIKATQEAIDQKRTRKADNDERNAQAKEDIEDLRNALSADGAFLLDLKERCAQTEHQYSERVAMRQTEAQAISEAITILSDDAARDTFSKVMNPAAFFQRTARRSRGGDARRTHAVEMLRSVGAKLDDPRLSALAATVKLDPMTRVKEAIDKLVEELLQEKELESQKRDACISRQHENEKLTETFTRDHSDLESKIEGYTQSVKDANETVTALTAEIAEMELEVKRAGEDRAAETKIFQATVADQREMQALLAKALMVLKAVYAKKEVPVTPTALVQTRGSQEPPPKGFETYGANRAAGGVLGLIEQIIESTKALEQETIRDEQKLQEDYERFVSDTNKSVSLKRQQIVNQNAAKAMAEQALITAKEDLKAKAEELENLGQTASAISMDCDFLVRNFDVRAQARDEEIEALREAKAVLSGMRLDV